ncbi:MAG: HigA family addiction module antitoxin [Desulfobulbaceae bacterium]|jgi:addiction module HigA family antidote|nr:HigA family addiction module antitoxin [Desulfobulbaceae bacterium]
MGTIKRQPTHPGNILKEDYLKPLSITIQDMASILAVSRKTLSKIVNEHGSVTPDMALRLSRAFDTTPELWLNLQKNYDLWHAAHDSTAWKRVKPVLPAFMNSHA